MRFHTVMFKTLWDLFSMRRSLLFLITILLAPVFFSMVASNDEIFNFETMTMATQIQMVGMIYILICFIWIAGIPLVILTSITCGDFITKEEQEGTLLLLVSKPVGRHEIVIGKYLAFLINIVILESLGILLSTIVMYSLLPIDPLVLDTLAGLIPSILTYSLFVALVFGALATALSCMSRSWIKITITLIALTVAVYFGFMVFRGWMIAADIYEPYGANLDANYHLGNAYLHFIDSTGYRMTPPLQAVLGSFTGTYDATDPGKLYDKDLGAMYPSLAPKEYASPTTSMAWLLGLAFILLLLGILRFQKREIK